MRILIPLVTMLMFAATAEARFIDPYPKKPVCKSCSCSYDLAAKKYTCACSENSSGSLRTCSVVDEDATHQTCTGLACTSITTGGAVITMASPIHGAAWRAAHPRCFS